MEAAHQLFGENNYEGVNGQKKETQSENRYGNGKYGEYGFYDRV